jgi:homoserine kinase
VPPQLKGVLFIPDFEMPTEESRALLPSQISRKDAVYNLGRVALLVNALATGQLQYLRVATQDRLHQPARQSLFPAMSSFFEAALEAGAWGVFLSGGGPTILALTTDREEDIGKALLSTAQKAGINGKIRTACPSPVGAHLGAED